MNVPQALVNTVEVVLIKLTGILAIAQMDIMEPTVKLVIMRHHFKFVIDIQIYILAS